MLYCPGWPFQPRSLAAAPPADLEDAIQRAIKETASAEAESRRYRQGQSARQAIAIEWLHILQRVGAKAPLQDMFRAWLAQQRDALWPDTIVSLCRSAARSEGFATLALDLAVDVYSVLQSSREDAKSRADSYVRLARAVLTVSRPEARVYFDRAVAIANRIGDENLDRWTAILHLANAAGVREVPRARTAYRLSRVAELTYEYVDRDKHFSWDDTVEALTNLCASSAIAILSRWRDRRFGDSERLLPIVIYRLIEQGRIPVATPIVLGGLMADWERLADLQRALSAESRPAARSLVAMIAYRYMLMQSSTQEELGKLKELGDAYVLDFPDLDRLLAIERIRRSKEEHTAAPPPSFPQKERRSPDWNAIFEGVDLTDTAALHAAYSKVRTYDPPYEVEAFFRQALARVKVGQLSEFVCAITAWSSFGMFEVQRLVDALPSPLPKQVSFLNALRDALLLACRRAPRRVYRHGLCALPVFKTLYAQGVVSDRDVVRATLEGFALQANRLGSSELFQMLDPLASCLSTEGADEALNFGLDLLEDVLRPEDGDGPWQPGLQPPQSVIQSLAGYLWAGLGSPVVAERWQCAHVVRSMVELGWAEALQSLATLEASSAAAPYVDQRMEFYIWHARQWMLIGLARGALENPTVLRPFIPLLQGWLRGDHVLIREIAAQTLRTLVTVGELDDVDGLDSVNQSSFPEAVYSRWPAPRVNDALSADETPGREDKYYFGIDIGPYWFRELGEAFGLTQNAIERRAHHAIRIHMGWRRGSGWAEDARRTRKIYDEGETHHSHGSLPKTDDLRTYHGYHAMMLVAGALLRERPVQRHAEEQVDRFREWMRGYLPTRDGGRWIADGRDPWLILDPVLPEGYGYEHWCWSLTADDLDQKLVTDDGMVVLWGYWTSGKPDHDETVAVRSALVSRTGAMALVAALQMAPEFGRFDLPCAGGQEDLDGGAMKLRGWIADEDASDGFNEGDPWAKGLLYPGPAPSEDTIARLKLIRRSDGRVWTSISDGLLRRETWTHTQGYGQKTTTISGSRLSSNRELLKCLLDEQSDVCLILSVEIKRRPPEDITGEDGLSIYSQPYVRYYLMGVDGVAHSL